MRGGRRKDEEEGARNIRRELLPTYLFCRASNVSLHEQALDYLLKQMSLHN